MTLLPLGPEHLEAHGIPDADFPDGAMPWGLESVVHRLAGLPSPLGDD